MLKNKMKYLKVILSIVIICAAYFGDYVVFKSRYSNSFIFRAFSDSLVHGSLGCLSALIFFSHENNLSLEAYLFNVIFCTAISCLIDIDHFIVAKSLNLHDLSNLNQRGIFHNTSLWLISSTALLFYSYLQRRLNIYILTFMLILGFSSHHIRDGNRRGLLMYPLRNTPVIDKHLYYILLAVLPHIIAYCYLMFKVDFSRNSIVDYTIVV